MKLLNISKLALYGIFLNYYCYYVIKGTFMPYGTMLFFTAAVFFVAIDMLSERYIYIGFEVRVWALYAVLAFATTFVFCNSSSFMSDLVKYGQRFVLILIVAYICEREESIGFALRLLAVTAVAASIAILTSLNSIQEKLDISTGANLSANDIGALMAFGCFAVICAAGNRYRNNILWLVIRFASVIAMLSVIFIAGSRKSIYAVIIMVIAFVLICGNDYLTSSSIFRALVILALGYIAFRFVNQYLAPYMEETNLYVRLFGRGAETANASNDARVELYIQALQEFVTHPIIGLGYNGFAREHANYTHSTYVETLACSGVIGLLYIIPYFRMFFRQIDIIRANRHNRDERLWQKELMVFMIAFLFIGIGIPYIYKDIPCIILGMFIASQRIASNDLREEGIAI